MTAVISKDFGRALCDHFGLPPDQVGADIEMTTATNEFFGAKVFICLTADDMAGIAAHMGGKAPVEQAPTSGRTACDAMGDLIVELKALRYEMERARMIGGRMEDIADDGARKRGPIPHIPQPSTGR